MQVNENFFNLLSITTPFFSVNIFQDKTLPYYFFALHFLHFLHFPTPKCK